MKPGWGLFLLCKTLFNATVIVICNYHLSMSQDPELFSLVVFPVLGLWNNLQNGGLQFSSSPTNFGFVYVCVICLDFHLPQSTIKSKLLLGL